MKHIRVMPLLGMLLFGYACAHVVRYQPDPFSAERPVGDVAESPFARGLAGEGIVEPRSESIAVGTPLVAIVHKVAATVGARVKKGDPLFYLDTRALEAELKCQDADLASARAELKRVQGLPRSEELPVLEARVREARATLEDATDQATRADALHRTNAVAQRTVVEQGHARHKAQAQLEAAEAELQLKKAGASEHELAVAQELVSQAQSRREKVLTELERCIVRAPLDATVLAVHVHSGEFVQCASTPPPVVLGDLLRPS